MAWFTYRGKIAPGTTKWEATPDDRSVRGEALAAWERRCRGYDLFPQTVALEPEFVPFSPGRDANTGGWRTPGQRPQPPARRAHFHLLLPREQKVAVREAGDWLAALRGIHHPLALEVVSVGSEVIFQVSGAASEAQFLLTSLQVAFPLAKIEAGKDPLRAWTLSCLGTEDGSGNIGLRGTASVQVVDFGLYHPAYQPLRRFERFSSDPLQGILHALDEVQSGGRAVEMAGVQVLAVPTAGDWGGSLRLLVDQFVTDQEARSVRGRPQGGRGDALARRRGTNWQGPWHKSLAAKLESPLWATSVRVFAASTQGSSRAFSLCQHIGNALSAFDEAGSNELVALENEGYSDLDHWMDVVDRGSRRTGMLLSQDELVGMLHPPTEHLAHPKLLRHDPNLRPLPEELAEAPGTRLGIYMTGQNVASQNETVNSDEDAPSQLVRWPDAYRNRHAYILGATRMGKSTLLLNMIAQDMDSGRGLCLIDPHGDLAQDVLALVPPERAQDVLFLDLSDTQHPLALGLFDAADEWERGLLVSDLLSILHRVFTSSWGDRLEHILRHVLLTLLADRSPHTLRDIRTILADEAYRDAVLSRVREPDLLAFWRSEFPGYPASALAPVYNKLGLLLSSPVLRNIVAQAQSRLDFSRLIAEHKIVIVNLAQSLIGEDNAHFLGALLVSKVQLAAMHSLRHSRTQRHETTLYVDEFQNFVVSSFEKILSEAGKAGLSLVMANQFLEQLSEKLQTGILSNVGMLMSFRVSADSGRRLEREFGGHYEAGALADQDRGRAIVRLGKASDSFALSSFPPPAATAQDPGQAERIVQRTRLLCCRPRWQVEDELAQESASRSSDNPDLKLLGEDRNPDNTSKPKKENKPKASTPKAPQRTPMGHSEVSPGIEPAPADLDSPDNGSSPEPSGGASPASASTSSTQDESAQNGLTENTTESNQEQHDSDPDEPLIFGLPDPDEP